MPFKDPVRQKAYWAERYRLKRAGKPRLRAAPLPQGSPESRAKHAAYEHRRGMLRNYGITAEHYAEMLKAQKGRCAICQSADTGPKRRMCVDHDHKTKKVRGLLCSNCNIAIGLFKENGVTIRSALFYIMAHR